MLPLKFYAHLIFGTCLPRSLDRLNFSIVLDLHSVVSALFFGFPARLRRILQREQDQPTAIFSGLAWSIKNGSSNEFKQEGD